MRIPVSILVAAAMVLLLVSLAWVPQWRPLAWFPALVLVCCIPYLLHAVASGLHGTERARFFAGLCPRCGYDLRAAGGHCPECGSPAWRPEMPLDWPDALWPGSRLTKLITPEEVVGWMLERRGPTPDDAWGDDPRGRAIAALVVRVCQPTVEGAPYGAFRPCDRFAVMSSATTVDQFAAALDQDLGVTLTPHDLAPYEAMSLGDVVSDLSRRSVAFPSATWSRPPWLERVTFVRLRDVSGSSS